MHEEHNHWNEYLGGGRRPESVKNMGWENRKTKWYNLSKILKKLWEREIVLGIFKEREATSDRYGKENPYELKYLFKQGNRKWDEIIIRKYIECSGELKQNQ